MNTLSGIGRILGALALAGGMLAGVVLLLVILLYVVGLFCRFWPLVGRRHRPKRL